MSFPGEPATQLTRKTLRGLGWQALGSGVKIAFSIVPVAVLARILTPAQFGLMTAATVVVLFLQRMALFGIGATLVQLNPLRSDHVGSAYLISASSGSIFALAIALASKKIEVIMGIAGVGDLMPFLALVLPLEAITQTSSRILQRNLIFSAEPVSDTVSYVIGYYLIAIPLALAGYGVWSLVAATLVFQISRVLIMLYYSRRFHSWNFSVRAARELSASGAAIMAGGLFETVGYNADRFFLGRFVGVVDLGFYGRAADLAQRFSSTFEVFIWKTVYAAYSHRQDNIERLAMAVERGSALAVIVVAPAAIFLSVYGREFIDLIYGAKRWEAAVLPFQVLAFALVLRVLDRVHVMAGNARGRFRFNACMQAVFAILSIATSLVAAPYGIRFLPFAMLAVIGAKVVLAHVISFRAVNLRKSKMLRAYGSALPAIAVAAACIVSIHIGVDSLIAGAAARLAVGALATSAAALLALWLFPAQLLGPSGLWLLKQSGATKHLARIPGSWNARARLDG